MREVHIVRPYVDGPIEVFEEYSTAYMRKCELDSQFGKMAVIETFPIQDYKLSPIVTRRYGPSGVQMFGGQAVRRNADAS